MSAELNSFIFCVYNNSFNIMKPKYILPITVIIFSKKITGHYLTENLLNT